MEYTWCPAAARPRRQLLHGCVHAAGGSNTPQTSTALSDMGILLPLSFNPNCIFKRPFQHGDRHSLKLKNNSSIEVTSISSIILPAPQIPTAWHFFCLSVYSAHIKRKQKQSVSHTKRNFELLELQRQIQLFTKRSRDTHYFCYWWAINGCFGQTFLCSIYTLTLNEKRTFFRNRKLSKTVNLLLWFS